MTEMRFGVRTFAFAIVIGIVLGITLGCLAGWIVWPVEFTNVDPSDLKPAAQEDFIVLVANTYAADQDLDRAKERLAQLRDKSLTGRVAQLAKNHAEQNSLDAPRLAVLAIALGVSEPDLDLLAATPTPTPTQTPTITPTALPSATPTLVATATSTPTNTATRRPLATGTPKPTIIAPTTWIPSLSAWPGGVKFEPISVAPGQRYWHLTKAMFCDLLDKHDYCQDLPGGTSSPGIWVTLLDSAGGRTTATLIVTKPDGSRASPNDIGDEKTSGDMCNCNYSFPANGWPIQVGGAPSDKIGGLSLPQNYHVRYFLTFQLVTK